MKKTIAFLALGAAFSLMAPLASAYTSAQTAALKKQVAGDKSHVTQIVSSKVSESPVDAAVIVKAAIEASKANAATVAAIVKAAGLAAPDKLDEIAEAALVAAPDAVNEVQAVVASLRPQSSVLDFPGAGIGPNGMFPEFSARGPQFVISNPVPDETPPVVTTVNF